MHQLLVTISDAYKHSHIFKLNLDCPSVGKKKTSIFRQYKRPKHEHLIRFKTDAPFDIASFATLTTDYKDKLRIR